MAGPDLSIESTYSGIIVGIDEAGRGPWAGPVVAAAVIVDAGHLHLGIDDSKKLPVHKREIIYDALIISARTSVGIASVDEIDTHNILGATMLALRRAL